MFDIDAFCTSLAAPVYGDFSDLLASQIGAWAKSGNRVHLAQMSRPHDGGMRLDSNSEELLCRADDIVVRRILAAFLILEMEYWIAEWMQKRNGMDKASGLFASLVNDWEGMGIDREKILAAIERRWEMNLLVDDTEPTCIGAWLLTVPDADLPKTGAWQSSLLFARHAPKRALAVVRKAFQGQHDEDDDPHGAEEQEQPRRRRQSTADGLAHADHQIRRLTGLRTDEGQIAPDGIVHEHAHRRHRRQRTATGAGRPRPQSRPWR